MGTLLIFSLGFIINKLITIDLYSKNSQKPKICHFGYRLGLSRS